LHRSKPRRANCAGNKKRKSFREPADSQSPAPSVIASRPESLPRFDLTGFQTIFYRAQKTFLIFRDKFERTDGAIFANICQANPLHKTPIVLNFGNPIEWNDMLHIAGRREKREREPRRH